jgi:hypothetical protein
MTNKTVARSLAVLTCGALALSATSASGSGYTHPTAVNATAVSYTPHVVATAAVAHPAAYTIAEAGTQMVVGGNFDAVQNGQRNTQYSRSNVFAFDATTGAISTTFAPIVNGEVWSTLSDGTSVWIGGGFTTVNGVTRKAIAKVDLATGELDPAFTPAISGRVSDMQMHNGLLVIAGTFRRRLMAINPNNGNVSTYIPNVVTGKLPNSNSAQVFKFDISPNGEHLVAVGNFTTVDDEARPRVFMLDLGATTATLSSWHYYAFALSCSSTRKVAIPWVQDVDFAPDSSYFALAAFGYMFQSGQRFYQPCDAVSRFETNILSPTKPTWINYTGGDSLKSVAVTGAAIYVQGHSRWLNNPYGQDFKGPGGLDRMGGGAINPTTGLALDWNPNMPQQSGGFQIVPTATGVWFATDGTYFGGKYHRGIRFAPLP